MAAIRLIVGARKLQATVISGIIGILVFAIRNPSITQLPLKMPARRQVRLKSPLSRAMFRFSHFSSERTSGEPLGAAMFQSS